MTTIPKPTSIRKNSNRNASHPSHLPPTPPTLHPLPASLLLSQDPRLSRLLTHDRNDFFSTGCRELDSHVLLNAGLGGGGFEGGCVVGLSCEEEETIGLAIGLQVVARMLLMSSSSSSSSSSSGSKAKAMIITTLSTTSLLPRLRLALVSEARVLQGNGNAHHQVDRGVIMRCLERVLVARVFDAEGLREVLRELEEVEQQQQTVVSHSDGNEGRRGGGETGEKGTERKEDGLLPHLIIITNTSHLLNTLFTRNKTGSDRSAAHNSAVQLSDQIRGLSRRGPLVMMLNSTTSPTTTTSSSSFNTNSISMFDDNNNNKGPKQPDLSIMRSIFNPPPPTPLAPIEAAAPGYMGGLVGGHTAGAPSAASYRGPGGYGGRGGGYGRNHHDNTHLHPHQTQTQSAARRNMKPSYGMVFTQMLDLHLLCTKVPTRGRTRRGGGAYGGGGGGYGGYGGGYVWAVEVLLDELGVYEGSDVVLDKVSSREGGEEEEKEQEKEGQGEQQEAGRRNEEGQEGKRKGKGKGLTRRSREQRWGAVEIEEGSGRVVDAFK
ncbi:hypothetical protein GE21DRAFT_2031 [Neurospora crassa]|uniref:DNA recombination and repair protein Rad51-like C-terminal domain-containing protein n=1 Tax=Neurospora crassa (strain ATCC 24698 / 74-OR23-1A / CBS 708.71 / DSM 1257 / FGSC 987) TaxID=367110 RepID=Q7SHW6_NEUCR|nr:hypothetical protein NCU00688 [Neurospora crassa OR74A]EAA36592.1 hypothetical protein NCU00688 [Neurospora crassa OR74A]KHE89769.1 hypothetical protein GE21DRAFT_2031 [Neurospora crassa]|eukprot:XP_965828.1 hypothetical protein NCU00688 [Neurospora crassa OR74A]